MDSDGISEVVIVTKDGRLKTMRVPTTSGDRQLPELSVVNETQLPLETDEDGLVSYPVVMETGFITEYLSMVQVRKQVQKICPVGFVTILHLISNEINMLHHNNQEQCTNELN